VTIAPICRLNRLFSKTETSLLALCIADTKRSLRRASSAYLAVQPAHLAGKDMHRMQDALQEMKFPQAALDVTTKRANANTLQKRSLTMKTSDAAFERISAPKSLLWPGDRRIAVVFNVAYEMWTPDATSGVGPMGNMLAGGLFDPNADSYGKYNASVGARRLLNIAQRNGVVASVLTSGMVAEHHAAHIKQVSDGGHEIVGHAYAQNFLSPTMTADQDARSITRTTRLIERATGARPEGWISPRVTSGPDTHRRLIEHGYSWHGDALDDDLPYLQRYPEGDIVAVPMSIDFNDLPHAMRFGRTPRQFVEMFFDALDAIQKQPAETIILDIFAHGHCYGRPAAAWAIDEILQRCAAFDDLWMTTRNDIAEHFRAHLSDNPEDIR
jgi:peptidoglycan/xylan/chitin deacetylase (PgdA/CDA1 family)